MKTLRVKSLCCGLSLVAAIGCIAPSAQAAKKSNKAVSQPTVSIEAWPGQRTMLILAPTLGANWNSDPTLGQALLRQSLPLLESALRKTGKLGIMELQPYNPIFLRAVQDRRMTADELNTLTSTSATNTTPWLDRARQALSKLSFEQQPLIGDFTIEEIRSSGDQARPAIQVQASGRMYELGGAAPSKTVVVTSQPMRSGRQPLDAILMAAGDAFKQIAASFVSPIEITDLPRVAAQTTQPGTGTAMPAAPGQPMVPAPVQPSAPLPPTLPNGSPLPGNVPITGSSSRNSAFPTGTTTQPGGGTDTGQPTQPAAPPAGQTAQPVAPTQPTETPAPANTAPTAPAIQPQ